MTRGAAPTQGGPAFVLIRVRRDKLDANEHDGGLASAGSAPKQGKIR
jgi:hypothetical protein